jgi:hypothetical protein
MIRHTKFLLDILVVTLTTMLDSLVLVGRHRLERLKIRTDEFVERSSSGDIMCHTRLYP